MLGLKPRFSLCQRRLERLQRLLRVQHIDLGRLTELLAFLGQLHGKFLQFH